MQKKIAFFLWSLQKISNSHHQARRVLMREQEFGLHKVKECLKEYLYKFGYTNC